MSEPIKPDQIKAAAQKCATYNAGLPKTHNLDLATMNKYL